MLENKEITTKARSILKGNWVLVIITSISITVVAEILSAFLSALPILGFFLQIALDGIVAVGLSLFFLNLVNNNNPIFKDGLDGLEHAIQASKLYLLNLLYILLWALLLIIPGIIAAINYSLLGFIFAENKDMPVKEILQKSKEMMLGHKWQAVRLCLRLILWVIPCLLTLGIGFVWLIPYAHTSFTVFYNEVKAAN